jgi:chitinase
MPSGSFGYQDIEDHYLPGYTRGWDQEAQVPWLYSPDTGIMISYEDPESLRSRTAYAQSNQLGGIMIWELAADDDRGTLVNNLPAALT